MTAQEELARRIERDSICRAVQKKIDEGKADFSDTARYNDRAAELLGEVLAAYVPDMPPEERETLCKAFLRQRYLDTNAMLNAVQRALDAAQGLHLAPQIADYPEERVEQAAHALADETVPVETIVRRAKSAPATIARSFQDDYIEKNASFRDSAGLKCYINRIAAGGCCKWCTAMAGRYRYGEEPEDVYRRHDNCSCTVTYESGRQRQDVWPKRTWEVPGIGAGAEKPTVFSAEQARALQDKKGLTILLENATIEMRHTGLAGRIFQSVQQLLSGNPSAASNEYLENLPKLSAPDTIMRALRLTNPSNDEENCARCVPAYEMRRRGYDVIAAKAPKNWLDDNIGLNDFRKVFLNMEWKECDNNDKKEIEIFLLEAGHGSRVEISLKTKKGLHLFVAENDNGRIRFIDPQKSLGDVQFYFNYSRVGKTEYARIDNLVPSALIKDCLEVAP